MSLQERLKHPGMDSVTEAIPVHFFTALFSEWATGGPVLASQVASALNLDAQEVTQAQNLKTAYDLLSTDIEKIEFLQKLENAGLLFSRGVYSVSEYATRMGL